MGRPAERHKALHCNVVRRSIVLMHNGDFPGKFFQRKVLDVFPVKENIPPARIQVLGHQIEQRRFAASVGTQDGRDLPLLDLE